MTWGIEVKVENGEAVTRSWGEVKDGRYTINGHEDAQNVTVSTSVVLPKVASK